MIAIHTSRKNIISRRIYNTRFIVTASYLSKLKMHRYTSDEPFILRPIYTTQLLPKTVACNVLTTWVVLCKSSTQLNHDNVGELCAWLLLLYLSRIPTSPKCFSVGSFIINFNFNTYILQNNMQIVSGFVVSKTKKIQRLSKIFAAYFQRLFKDL
jgi:hypothetical protein